MCGIFGHVGGTRSVDQCLKGLKFLEYRGYDSIGIAGISEGKLLCYKEKGKIGDLEKLLDEKIQSMHSSIGHTRWATHGEATQLNAHPHLDQAGSVAVVHNGIIENYRALRQMLEASGVSFSTDTDSEVVAQLIAHLYEGNLIEAVRKATEQMRGFWGLAIIHKDHPGQIIATCKENPIVVGVSEKDGEAFVSSDAYAFMRSDLNLYYLNDGEIAILEGGAAQIFGERGLPIEKEARFLKNDATGTDKGEFEHFMLKEIYEQPMAIRKAIEGRFAPMDGTARFEHFSLTKEEFASYQRVLILGCGTSWHAGCIAALQIEELAQIPAEAQIASEYRYRHHQVDERTLVIALSQSGETFDTIAAVRKVKQMGARVVAICNVPGSTLMRESDDQILLHAGPEISVCSTKAFTSQLAVLSLVTLKLARFGPMTLEEGELFLSEILKLPSLAERVLEKKAEIDLLAKQHAHFPHFFFLGRQYMYYTALEGALKLKEISYLNANGYPAGELKHGPIALIDPRHVVVGLCGNRATYEKIASNLTEVKARKGVILAFAPEKSEEIESIASHLISLPEISDPLSCIPYSIALQLFAYAIALELGAEIDQPRNLAKSVTVE